MSRRCCNVEEECTEACATDVTCRICGERKHRAGRSEPLGFHGCEREECAGYKLLPYAPHLWPNEWADHLAGHSAEDDIS